MVQIANRLSQSNIRKIIALSTEIGRGHPNYLDSILSLLQTEYAGQIASLEYRTVFQETVGLSRFAWNMVKKLYLLGGSGGIITNFYNALRQKSSSPNQIFLKILGTGLFASLTDSPGIILVEHPLVARILVKRNIPVFYIHGEIAAPKECVIPGVTKCFVPLELTKARMVACGAKPETIIVTELLIEPVLVKDAQKNFSLRMTRLTSNSPLTVAFFTSQAYPKAHIAQIIAGVESVVEKGMKAIVFTGSNRDKAWQIQNQIESLKRHNLQPWQKNIQVIMSKSRQEENQQTVELIGEIDIFVAAAHERTNLAVGLGIPMFVLSPLIGTYASQNFDFAYNQGVAFPLRDINAAKSFGEELIQMRKDNTLKKMAEKGFSVHSLNGARNIAEDIIKSL